MDGSLAIKLSDKVIAYSNPYKYFGIYEFYLVNKFNVFC